MPVALAEVNQTLTSFLEGPLHARCLCCSRERGEEKGSGCVPLWRRS